MAEGQTFLKPGKYGSSYGSITTASKRKPSPAKQSVLQHKVKHSDTLMSLAVKYETSVEDIKRLNNVWSNESLQIKSTINIPVASSKLKSDANGNRSMDLEEFVSSDSCPSSATDFQSTAKDKKAKGISRSHTYSSEADIADMKPTDFLKKYDIQIMHLKSNVEKLEADSSLSEEDSTFGQLPKRTSKYMNRKSFRTQDQLLDENDPLDSPELLVKSKRKNHNTSASNATYSQDEFFHL